METVGYERAQNGMTDIEKLDDLALRNRGHFAPDEWNVWYDYVQKRLLRRDTLNPEESEMLLKVAGLSDQLSLSVRQLNLERRKSLLKAGRTPL